MREARPYGLASFFSPVIVENLVEKLGNVWKNPIISKKKASKIRHCVENMWKKWITLVKKEGKHDCQESTGGSVRGL